jgi:hypothetical protein
MNDRKRKRAHAMLWAYLYFNMRNEPQGPREILCWRYLIEWAALGGKPDEAKGL